MSTSYEQQLRADYEAMHGKGSWDDELLFRAIEAVPVPTTEDGWAEIGADHTEESRDYCHSQQVDLMQMQLARAAVARGNSPGYSTYRIERDDGIVEYIRVPRSPAESVLRQYSDGSWHEMGPDVRGQAIERIADHIASAATVEVDMSVRILKIKRVPSGGAQW